MTRDEDGRPVTKGSADAFEVDLPHVDPRVDPGPDLAASPGREANHWVAEVSRDPPIGLHDLHRDLGPVGAGGLGFASDEVGDLPTLQDLPPDPAAGTGARPPHHPGFPVQVAAEQELELPQPEVLGLLGGALDEVGQADRLPHLDQGVSLRAGERRELPEQAGVVLGPHQEAPHLGPRRLRGAVPDHHHREDLDRTRRETLGLEQGRDRVGLLPTDHQVQQIALRGHEQAHRDPGRHRTGQEPGLERIGDVRGPEPPRGSPQQLPDPHPAGSVESVREHRQGEAPIHQGAVEGEPVHVGAGVKDVHHRALLVRVANPLGGMVLHAQVAEEEGQRREVVEGAEGAQHPGPVGLRRDERGHHVTPPNRTGRCRWHRCPHSWRRPTRRRRCSRRWWSRTRRALRR